MRTGHTSLQEPHRLHANGRLAWRVRRRGRGSSTEPIGPATGAP